MRHSRNIALTNPPRPAVTSTQAQLLRPNHRIYRAAKLSDIEFPIRRFPATRSELEATHQPQSTSALVGLSRQRFHQLRGTTFPEPDYDPETKRPYYDQEKQTVCLSVRQRNCGINGKPILFYARRNDVGVPRKAKKPTTKPKVNKHARIVEGLRALGLSSTASQVDAAAKMLFPNGTKTVEDAEIVRSVFLHLQQAENQRQEHGG